MTYVPTNWQDYPNLSTAIDAARLNNMEAGIVAAYVLGSGGLLNADIANAAGISYSKLSLALSIVNGDISASAAIAISKLAGYPSDATKTLKGDGTWGSSSSELDYAQITANISGITATTEGTATAVITGASVAYDGTKVRVEFGAPAITFSSTTYATFVFFRDSTVLGQFRAIGTGLNLAGGDTELGPTYFATFDTPSVASHTYSVKAFVSAGTLIVMAGAGSAGALTPAFLRVSRA